MKPLQERLQAVYDGLISKGRKRITVADMEVNSIFHTGGSLIGCATEIKDFLKAKKDASTSTDKHG